MNQRDFDDNYSSNSSFESNLLNAMKKTLELLRLDDHSNYGKVMASSIQQKAVEIEMKIDEFLDDLKIPFRPNEFLLLLFQELYENFMFSKRNFVSKV